jgi:hypothetical protein
VKRVIAINVAVVVGLLVLFLASIEIYLRATVPPSSGGGLYEYTLETRRYKVMKANATVTAFGEELRTNERGFRDRPFAPKQPGEKRIVVIGDSFTVSAGVAFDEIFTARLEKALGARVINLAVGGYNIVQYALLLEEVGLALEPDLVVLALFPDNDFTNDTYEANYRVAAGQASAEPPQPWYESLYVYRAYGTRLQAKLAGMLAAKSAAAAPGGRKTGAWEDNAAALKAIAASARTHGVPLKVVMLPHTWNLERQRPLFARVQKECAGAGVLPRARHRGARPRALAAPVGEARAGAHRWVGTLWKVQIRRPREGTSPPSALVGGGDPVCFSKTGFPPSRE